MWEWTHFGHNLSKSVQKCVQTPNVSKRSPKLQIVSKILDTLGQKKNYVSKVRLSVQNVSKSLDTFWILCLKNLF